MTIYNGSHDEVAHAWAEWEGQQFELSVEFSTATASCSEHYPDEEYC